MSDLKMSDWHNAKAEIIFTVGIRSSASVDSISEKYTDGESCDSVYQDLFEEGSTTFLESIGIDTSKEGTFIAKVLVKCNYDESPDYKLESVIPYDTNQTLIDSQAEAMAELQKDKELLRKYMLFIAKETDNETLSISGVNKAANEALKEVKI